MGKVHPLAWYHHFDGGRSFYTALGHVPATFDEPAFLDHIYAGIVWAAIGRK
jgi:type 1 glutamine amidotransferase